MRRLSSLVALFMTVSLFVLSMPAFSQGGEGFQWPAPLSAGEQPLNAALLPPSNVMPRLPLDETLIKGTLFFNAEAFGEEYRILNLTLDKRLYAYNISTERGVLPVSPNGQYGVTTVLAAVPGGVSCGIMDLLTGGLVDQFELDGACSGVAWSPDSTRLLITIADENGQQFLAIRQNGQTTPFEALPVPEADLGGGTFSGDRLFIINGWLSNDVISFDVGLQGFLTETLFVDLNNPTEAFPAISLQAEHANLPLVLWRPAQPLGALTRSLWLTNLGTGDSFQLSPIDSTAIIGDISPDATQVVYWAATVGPQGPAHPLRLAIYDPETDQQTVLLQFDGPSDIFATRPGLVIWNEEGIYFQISQQEGAISQLKSGVYRIQADGTALEFVSEELLMGVLR